LSVRRADWFGSTRDQLTTPHVARHERLKSGQARLSAGTRRGLRRGQHLHARGPGPAPAPRRGPVRGPRHAALGQRLPAPVRAPQAGVLDPAQAAADAAGGGGRPGTSVGRCSSAWSQWSGPRGRPGACAGAGTGSSRVSGAPRTRARVAVARYSPAHSGFRANSGSLAARQRVARCSAAPTRLRVAVALAPAGRAP
jgi:hypothetical protein